MTRRAWPLALALALGCPRSRPAAPPTTPTATHQARVAGVELRVLPRETEGLVELHLFVDAGTLDATPPSAAVLTAWALEREGLTAEATPQHLRLRTRRGAGELEAGLRALADALGQRSLAPERHAELVARWRTLARHAKAQPERRADALALRRLLGDAADPFGGEAATVGEVESFMAAHLGSDRALLVVVGDVRPPEIERAVRRTFASAPRAGRTRGEVRAGEGGVATDVLGEDLRATVAVEVGTRAAALGLGRRALRSELAESVAVYPHAAGVALLLRTRDLPRLRAATWLARHAAPAPVSAAAARIEDEVEDEALRWRGAEPAERRRVAVGVVCPHEVDGCEERAAEATRVGFVELGRRVEADGASATYVNGARVRVEPRRGREVAFALRFETGGAAHGEAVVLAHALARRCGVRARLDATGFTLVGGGEAWRAQLRATIDCVTAGVRSTARDRLRLVDRLRAHPERGWIAEALAPGMTSRVAPEGRLHEVAGVTSAQARARLRELRVGRRVVLALVGPITAAEGIEAAPMLGSWPAGEAAPQARWGAPIAVVPQPWDDDRARVVFGWRVDVGHEAAALPARAFAAAVADRLGAHGPVRWYDGDGGPWGAWAAVAIDLRPEEVEAAPALAREAAADLDVRWEPLATQERWRTGEAAEAAWRLARFGRTASPAGGSELARVVAGLRRSAPVFAVGRRQHSGALRRLRRAGLTR